MSMGIPHQLPNEVEIYTGPNCLSRAFERNDEMPYMITGYLSLEDNVNLSKVDTKIHRKVNQVYFGDRLEESKKIREAAFESCKQYRMEYDRLNLNQAAYDLDEMQSQVASQGGIITAIVNFLSSYPLIVKIVSIFSCIFPCLHRAFQLRADILVKQKEISDKLEHLQKAFPNHSTLLKKYDDDQRHLREWSRMVDYVGGFSRLQRISKDLGVIELHEIPNGFYDGVYGDKCVAHFTKDFGHSILRGSFKCQQIFADFIVIKTSSPNKEYHGGVQVFITKFSNSQKRHWFSCGDQLIVRSNRTSVSSQNHELIEIAFPQFFKTMIPSFIHRAESYISRFKKLGKPLNRLPYSLTLKPCQLSEALGGWDTVLSLPYCNIRTSIKTLRIDLNDLEHTMARAREWVIESQQSYEKSPKKKIFNDEYESIKKALSIEQGDELELVKGRDYDAPMADEDRPPYINDHFIAILRKRNIQKWKIESSEILLESEQIEKEVIYVALLSDVNEYDSSHKPYHSRQYRSIGVYHNYPRNFKEHEKLLQFIDSLKNHLLNTKQTLGTMGPLPHDLVKKLLA